MRTIRQFAILAIASLSLLGCRGDSTDPSSDDASSDVDAALSIVAAAGATTDASALVPRLPDSLRLSDAQRAQISQLTMAFKANEAADMQALLAVQQQAIDARHAGKSSAEVQAIATAGTPIAKRLTAGYAKLNDDVTAVLTPGQVAWMKAHDPRACITGNLKLTPAQSAQMMALFTAFNRDNAADIAAVKQNVEAVLAAIKAGQPYADILKSGEAALVRLTVAQVALDASIGALLTADQKAAGCFPL